MKIWIQLLAFLIAGAFMRPILAETIGAQPVQDSQPPGEQKPQEAPAGPDKKGKKQKPPRVDMKKYLSDMVEKDTGRPMRRPF